MLNVKIKKGKTPWNKGLKGEEYIKHYKNGIIGSFKKGNSPWNKEKKGLQHHSSKTRWKIGVGNRGKPRSEETKRKIRDGNKGKIVSEETRRRIGKTSKGRYPTKETRDKMGNSRRGEKNGRWLGGISFEPYTIDFNKQFKGKIRERDNHCCVICSKSQNELKRKLVVHHIDYNKLNTFPQNCISLCLLCHIQTNTNRTSWTVFFQSLLKEKYGYQYTQNQKIILDFMDKIIVTKK